MLKFELTNHYGVDIFIDYHDERPLEARMKSAKEEKERNELAKSISHAIVDYTVDWNVLNNITDWEDYDVFKYRPDIEEDLKTHDLDYLNELARDIDTDQNPTDNLAYLFHHFYMKRGLKRWNYGVFYDDYKIDIKKVNNAMLTTITRIR